MGGQATAPFWLYTMSSIYCLRCQRFIFWEIYLDDGLLYFASAAGGIKHRPLFVPDVLRTPRLGIRPPQKERR